jgi:hypothetical protein
VTRLRPAAFLALALLAVLPGAARAASCCGGGGGGGVQVPKGYLGVLDLGFDAERYDGYWDGSGRHLDDPAGSSLAQYRLNLAGGWRFSKDWQVSLLLPMVHNDSRYTGLTSRSTGVGDTTVTVLYDAHDERSIWKVLSAADLLPSVKVGGALTVPTGLSQYDDVDLSFDVTGRGYYRLDATAQVDKTFRGLSASLSLAYGVHLPRPINRLYGAPVTPTTKRLGNKATAALSLGYRLFIGSAGDALTLTGALSWLHEAATVQAGERLPESTVNKPAFSTTLLWSSTDHDWSARVAWAHTLQRDGWGTSFPTTDIVSLGVKYAIR